MLIEPVAVVLSRTLPRFPSPSAAQPSRPLISTFFSRFLLHIITTVAATMELARHIMPPGESHMSTPIPVIPASVRRAIPASGDNLVLDPVYRSAAVSRCCEAWNIVYRDERAKGTPGVSCYLRANEAYRYAMPLLTTTKNIRDYIACCAHGMMARTIDMIVAPQLIAAARVACRAHQCEIAVKKGGSKRAPKIAKTRSQRGSASNDAPENH